MVELFRKIISGVMELGLFCILVIRVDIVVSFVQMKVMVCQMIKIKELDRWKLKIFLNVNVKIIVVVFVRRRKFSIIIGLVMVKIMILIINVLIKLRKMLQMGENFRFWFG